MTSTKKERSVVVIELQGGNDALNTVIPYNNPLYYDFRNNVGIPEADVLHLDGEVGLNPSLAPMKHLWDQGNLGIINGIGYPNPNRSHFRSRDVWYTAESEKIGAEGWLGAAIRDLDARGENVLTGVNFGRGLPSRHGLQGRSGGVGCQPGDLRPDARHPGREVSPVRAGGLQPHLRPHREQGHRGPGAVRNRLQRPQGRRPAAHRSRISIRPPWSTPTPPSASR